MLEYLNIFLFYPPTVNSLPNDKILDMLKFKQIADDIFKCI